MHTSYSEGSGIGRLLALQPRPGRRIAVVGLGIGTLAVYGRRGDLIRFYEINPAVTAAAGEYFTYLEESQAEIDIVMGDARLSLEREPPGNYDIIVLDVFNSDSPPVHLLTREAFELYFSHLRPNGVIAVNITNKHLDMSGLLYQQARESGALSALLVNTDEPPFVSSWFLMSRDRRLMKHPHLQEIVVSRGDRKGRVTAWTDDYTSLFQVLE
jgi:protein-L-isoaspartate O-methyltransferase